MKKSNSEQLSDLKSEHKVEQKSKQESGQKVKITEPISGSPSKPNPLRVLKHLMVLKPLLPLKPLLLLRARISYLYAKSIARQRYNRTGRRQFIVMTDSGKLLIMDKSVFYSLRKGGHMSESIKPHMLPRISVWYTRGHHGGKPSPEISKAAASTKFRRYLQYLQQSK